MKKTPIVLIVLFIGISSVFAQKNYKASKVFTLEFALSGGTNASAVTWNPAKKVFYSVIAGNASFPLETFNEFGEHVYSNEAGVDARGLWFNLKTKKLEGNGQGETGIFTIGFNNSGEKQTVKILIEGKNQPGNQSVGAFDSKKQIIYYYSDGKIYSYLRKNGKQKSSFNITNSQIDTGNLNSTTVIFTGIKNQELGLLDYYLQKVYLFDLKGKLTAIINLPENAPTNNAFRFSFANNYIWLYDVDSRSWTGYSFN